MADRLQQADEPVLGFVRVAVVQRQPIRRAGVGMGPTELHPVMRPANRLLDGDRGIDAEARDAGDFARQPFVVVVAEALLQVLKRLREPLPDRRIDDLDPDLAAADLDRIDA